MTAETVERNSDTQGQTDRYDAVVIGAGFAGLYAMYRLREKGFTARGFDGAPDVGGTWYWNRYPGCRCDVESMQYSYQFSDDLQQDWDWSERFAAQPDILTYIRHVADRFDLRRDFQFDTRVTAAAFDEAADEWQIETDRGDCVRARFLILAVGCLSTANMPDFPGMADFEGDIFHTGHWPHEDVDFSGKRVGVIGTGSSAVQIIPLIAEQADALHVFQRTPNYVVPARNRPLHTDEVAATKAQYHDIRERAKSFPTAFVFPLHTDSASGMPAGDRERRLERQWAIGGLAFTGAFGDTLTNTETNDAVVEFWRKKLRETVADPKTAELLMPDEAYGCKRVCSGTDYYETYNRDNVSLVDVSGSGIERFTRNGLVAEGQEYDLDMVVCATGFDAMTGSVLKIDITGVGGQTIQEKWQDGPRTYLGLWVAGFPNMFNIAGPGSPSVLTSMVTAAEQHVDVIADCLDWMRDHDKTRVDATEAAEEGWGHELADVSSTTLRTGCDSWHLGSNIPGKPRQFMPYIGGFPKYVGICDDMAADGYRGLVIS